MASTAVTETAVLRADALGNRDRILSAAGEMFAELGTGVSMTDIAKRAGVGVATLFRRFATKEMLVDAVFTASVTWWLERLDEALVAVDAWESLRGLIEDVVAEQSRHPACADMFVTSFLHGDGFTDERDTVEAGFTVLINRAKDANQVVADLDWRDIALLLEANAGVVMAAEGNAAEASKRLTGRLLRAFATST